MHCHPLQSSDVAHWRLAKKSFVLAAELRRVIIADANSGASRIYIFCKQQAPCFLQSKKFLKLQWAHRCNRFEMLMGAGHAHSLLPSQVLYAKRLVEPSSQNLERALLALEQPANDFPYHQR